MKKLFDTEIKPLNNGVALLVGRVAISLLMLAHGLPKLDMLFSGVTIEFPSVFGLSAELSLTLAVFAEVFCSMFILVGFATRLASVPLIITMLVAIFYIHGEDVFAKKELAVLYLVGYIVLFVAGSGKYSVDHFLRPVGHEKYHPKHKPEDPTLSIYE